jgi:L-lactate dehydrogenase complex protein LldG
VEKGKGEKDSMSSKTLILEKLRRNVRDRHDLPDLDGIEGIRYPDRIARFIEISRAVGGDAVVLEEGESFDGLIGTRYPDVQRIASNLPGIAIATFDPDCVDDPRVLDGTDLAIVRGEFGVAENGSVWIPQNVRRRAVYFISEYLVILLKRENLVHNMYEAYRRIRSGGSYGYGVFISGPSKTADIEQALVVGAHGARGVTVVLE